MNDAGGVRCSRGIGDLKTQPRNLLKLHRSALDFGFERFTFHILHDDEVQAVGLFDRINGDNVGMIESARRPRLPQESSFGLCIEARVWR